MNPKAKIKMLGHELEIELTDEQIKEIYREWKEKIERNISYTDNEWQLCPKCMGEQDMRLACSVCFDEKIISTLNGQPPSKQ